MSIKIFVVGGQLGYANWIKDSELTDNFDLADMVLFTGGEDVTPSFYGENAHPTTSYNTERDIKEREYFNLAVKQGKNILGICRGSQFLCVMNGGSLVQHQQNNHHIHAVNTIDPEYPEIIITSTHHQAQMPYGLPPDEYTVIGYTKGISEFHEDGDEAEINLIDNKECEIVYYHKTKSLGIQGHPEFGVMANFPETIEYLNHLVGTVYSEEYFDRILEAK